MYENCGYWRVNSWDVIWAKSEWHTGLEQQLASNVDIPAVALRFDTLISSYKRADDEGGRLADGVEWAKFESHGVEIRRKNGSFEKTGLLAGFTSATERCALTEYRHGNRESGCRFCRLYPVLLQSPTQRETVQVGSRRRACHRDEEVTSQGKGSRSVDVEGDEEGQQVGCGALPGRRRDHNGHPLQRPDRPGIFGMSFQ